MKSIYKHGKSTNRYQKVYEGGASVVGISPSLLPQCYVHVTRYLRFHSFYSLSIRQSRR